MVPTRLLATRRPGLLFHHYPNYIISSTEPRSHLLRAAFLPHTPRRANAVSAAIDNVCSTTCTTLQLIHDSTGLPWAAVIPLSALLVRLFILTPFVTIPQRHFQHRFLEVSPQYNLRRFILPQTWHHLIMLGPSVHARRKQLMDEAERAAFPTRKSLALDRMKWLQRRSWMWSLLHMPVFLVVAESLRRMMGTHSSLLGLIAKWLRQMSENTGGHTKAADGTDSVTTTSSAGDAVTGVISPSLTSGRDADGGADEIGAFAQNEIAADNRSLAVTTAPEDIASTIPSQSPWFVPSMQDEGMLWFPDLTAFDPTFTLSFLVSGVTFTHIWLSTRGANPQDQKRVFLTPTQVFRRFMLGVSVVVLPPVTFLLPSGVLLYWLSSTTLTLMSTQLMEKWKPLRPTLPITPEPWAMSEEHLKKASWEYALTKEKERIMKQKQGFAKQEVEMANNRRKGSRKR
ncbi:hypothetical protein BDY21DRAFT_86501 [Lineolata rhizophorae]|uniref:60Kd inner membrane protein-domain-containing protein n=1 Tax=Lineolata rhizophorae TaxID=578093 RepID=A0A6A6PCC2_9PEZI|nr:hypothetical protein BDY21DRAFT_86501 [Lineolata rhizophorae]